MDTWKGADNFGQLSLGIWHARTLRRISASNASKLAQFLWVYHISNSLHMSRVWECMDDLANPVVVSQNDPQRADFL